MNIIQSVDGYVVRELGLRCNYDLYALRRALRLIGQLNVREEAFTGSVSIVRAYELSTQTMLSYSNAELCALQKLCNSLLGNPQFEQISVFDKFFCSPNYMNYLRQYVINIYAELAESNLMNEILSSVTKLTSSYTKVDSNMGDLIRESEYIIS